MRRAGLALLLIVGCARVGPTPEHAGSGRPEAERGTPAPEPGPIRQTVEERKSDPPPRAELEKTFPEVSPKQELFRVAMQKSGHFKFCLTGTKPARDRFVFQALVVRHGAVYRIDYVTAVPPGQTEINTCATMLKDEELVRQGEVVTIESILKTAGPLQLTLKIVELPQ